MHLFKFTAGADPTILTSGQFINGALSTMWVERYDEPGEFEIKAPLSSGLRDFLPEGTLISHVDTMEVMIVENQQVVETDRDDPTLVVTGRSFDTYLENRIVGTNLARASSAISEYVLTSDYVAKQAVKLINDHINAPAVANDRLTEVTAQTDIAAGTQEERTIDRGTVYARLRELLKVDDLGVRTIRKNPFGIGTGAATTTLYNVYAGVDRTKNVIFSWKSGDFSKIEYLFSSKKIKNSAIVVSRYLWTAVDLGPFKYERRIMIVDASDLDGHLSAAPSGGALTTQLNRMATRGRQALKRQQRVTIGAADVSDITKYRFRVDYNLGDLVMLDGNYGNILVVRITEYAEIEDENGYSGHPTLSIPGL